MRILHLSGEYPPWRIGGIATYLENVARRQGKVHQVGVVVLRGTDYNEDPPKETDGPSIQVFDMNVAEVGERAVIDRSTIDSLVPVEGLLAQPWDVLHVHDWFGTIPALALLGRGTANMLMTAHLPLRFGFTYANHPVPLGWKWRLEALGFRSAQRVVTPSRYVAALLEREYNVQGGKLRVVHNGVDVEHFTPGTVRAEVPTILAVSRLAEQKGLDHLLEIIAAVRTRVPDVRLEVAGQGPEREAFEAEVARLGLKDAVTVHGYVAHNELPVLYRRAHVFVSTSIYEPFGLTTLEAMACGTPVVVSHLGGAPEFVRDGQDGFVCWPHAVGGFAEAVGILLTDMERHALCARHARARAMAFDWKFTVEHLAQCYHEMRT